ncbi:hypothetical protein THASP1DRAFT_27007 [Thamnocephalis sphaerospora]|uniref:Uncharacterized protein n=1 Tax=Thamnocephalis sphaerospora TaxID=78915 RepID=A0A4P9XYI6_9FUNG|nr:hypothetical protein THASP1DRAFT_27007 [Thamnocephalis sphaerospora]|eukprot:RKP11172.1 hypothetical protein THASP1DRAFT_27007 [Thamnocephalis sphaerospora]
MQPCVRVTGKHLRQLARADTANACVATVTVRPASPTKPLSTLARNSRVVLRYGRVTVARAALRLRRRHLPDLVRRRVHRSAMLPVAVAHVKAQTTATVAAPAFVPLMQSAHPVPSTAEVAAPKKKRVRFSRFERVFEAHSPSDYDRSSVAPRYEALLAWQRMSAAVSPAVVPAAPRSASAASKGAQPAALEPLVASSACMLPGRSMVNTVVAPAGAAAPVYQLARQPIMLADTWSSAHWSYASTLTSSADLFTVPCGTRPLAMQR